MIEEEEEEEEDHSSIEVDVNKMSVRPDHNTIPLGHDISGARLLTPLRMDTIVR